MNIGQSLLSRKRNSISAFIPGLVFNKVWGCVSLADDKRKQRIFASWDTVDSAEPLLVLHAESVTRRAVE